MLKGIERGARNQGAAYAGAMSTLVMVIALTLSACVANVNGRRDAEKGPAQQKASESHAESTESRDLPKVSRELKAALHAFKDRYEVYWQKVLMAKHTEGEWAKPCAQPDALLRDIVIQAFRERLGFDGVQGLLEGTVQWQEMPENFGSDVEQMRAGNSLKGLEQGQMDDGARDKLPVILYSQLRSSSGNTVMVFQNTFVTDFQNSYIRNRMEPYVIVAFPDSVECSILTTELSSQSPEVTPFSGLLVPEIVEADYPVPGVAVLAPPAGTGHFLELYAFVFELRSRTWRLMGTKVWSMATTWEYSRTDGTLSKAGGSTDHFNVRAFVREGVEKLKRGEKW